MLIGWLDKDEMSEIIISFDVWQARSGARERMEKKMVIASVKVFGAWANKVLTTSSTNTTRDIMSRPGGITACCIHPAVEADPLLLYFPAVRM